jgi:hypothetical protein
MLAEIKSPWLRKPIVALAAALVLPPFLLISAAVSFVDFSLVRRGVAEVFDDIAFAWEGA